MVHFSAIVSGILNKLSSGGKQEFFQKRGNISPGNCSLEQEESKIHRSLTVLDQKFFPDSTKIIRSGTLLCFRKFQVLQKLCAFCLTVPKFFFKGHLSVCKYLHLLGINCLACFKRICRGKELGKKVEYSLSS